MSFEPYSALMPVYYKEKPEYLRLSMDSVFAQTVPPDEFVLVCDGELTEDLDSVIAVEQNAHPNLIVVRLPENRGTAVAFQEGMNHCKNDLIQKFGSDDYCRPERAELQLERYQDDPSLAVVGGYMQSFYDTPGDSDAVREVPCDHDGILAYARRRSPFNDLTVMYRKSAFAAVGGYSPELKRAQDYDVYVRILIAGYRTVNIPKVLADARENRDAINRRRTWNQLKYFAKVRWKIHKTGFSTMADFLIPCAMQLVLMVVPARAAEALYSTFLRKNGDSSRENK